MGNEKCKIERWVPKKAEGDIAEVDSIVEADNPTKNNEETQFSDIVHVQKPQLLSEQEQAMINEPIQEHVDLNDAYDGVERIAVAKSKFNLIYSWFGALDANIIKRAKYQTNQERDTYIYSIFNLVETHKEKLADAAWNRLYLKAQKASFYKLWFAPMWFRHTYHECRDNTKKSKTRTTNMRFIKGKDVLKSRQKTRTITTHVVKTPHGKLRRMYNWLIQKLKRRKNR